MNFFVLAPLTAAIINSFLGIFVFSRSPSSHANRIYLLFSAALVTWNLGVLLMFFTSDPDQALKVSRGLHFGVIFLPFFLLHIVFLILGIEIKRTYYAIYSLPLALSATNFTDLFIKDVKKADYSYYGVAGSGFSIFSFLLLLVLVAFLAAVLRKAKSASGNERQKIRSLLVAYFILLFSGIHDTLPVFEIYRYPFFGTTVYPLGMIGSIIFAGLLAYGVLQHQILNIYTNLGRIAATCARIFLLFMVFFLSLLTVSLILPEYFSYTALFSSIIIFLVTIVLGSILFPKLIGISEERLEKRMFGDRFEYKDKIRAFNHQLLYFENEAVMHEELNEILRQVFSFGCYYLFVLDEVSDAFQLQRSHPPVNNENLFALPTTSPFARSLDKNRKYFFNSRPVENFIHLDDLNEYEKGLIGSLDVKICFKLRSGSELLGFLMIGDKSNKSPITNLDLTLLLELTHNLGLFINQARLKKQIARSQEVELLGNLSRGLAHDLNNLITPIFTYCQLTEDAPETSEDLRSFAAVAKRNLHAMQSYVRESLFFSTNHEPKLRPVNVAVLLRQLHGLHEAALTAKGVDLKIVCPESLEMNLDDVLIQRLLSNLIHNALDASPENSVIEIIVTNLTRSFQRRKWVRITIQDHGIGIPEDQLEKIFTPYFTTKGTGDNRRGAGLGLPICRRIVDLHQGSISVSSKVSAGTRIDLDLPSALTPAPTSPIQSEVSAVNTDAAQQ